jgi:membrane glycosyltransferase
MGYVSSVLWLLMIVSGTYILISHGQDYGRRGIEECIRIIYGSLQHTGMFNLFLYTMLILFLPKLLGWAATMLQPRLCLQCGGRVTITAGVLVEIFFSILFSPITMLFNTGNIIQILLGRDSGWISQRRNLQRLSWKEAWHAHRYQCLSGTSTAVLVFFCFPGYFFCYLSLLSGLIFSVPLSIMSSSKSMGNFFLSCGLLLIPEETGWISLLAERDRIEQNASVFSGMFPPCNIRYPGFLNGLPSLCPERR